MDDEPRTPAVTVHQPSNASDQQELPVGSRVGRYELLEVLGHGGFGITYRARDVELHRDVAIKEYLPGSYALRRLDGTVVARSPHSVETFDWGRDRFTEEARTLARLERVPGVVNVYDIVAANGTAYMVMEYVHGQTLEAKLKNGGPLDQRTVERLLPPLLDGLELVHRNGFLHRDIKPSNILLGDDGRPSLIDFGSARAALQGRTQTLTAVYTPGYAAFEQLTSAKQGPPADIYALGATLYHAVTGRVPPSANDRMIEDRLVPAVAAGKGRYAQALLAAIDAALRLKAADRPQTIDAWRRLLAPGMVPAREVSGDVRRWPMWLAGGVLAACLAAAAPYVWYRLTASPQAPDPKVAADRVAAEKAGAEKAAADRTAVEKAAADRAAAEKVAAEKAAVEQAQGTIKIGLLAALDGPFAAGGQDAIRGAELALKLRGGVAAGRKIEIIKASSDAKPDVAVNATRKLVEQDKVHIMVGPLSGSEGIAVKDYSKSQPNITFINGSSGAQATTLVNPSTNFFRFNTEGAQWMVGLGDYVLNVKKYKKMAVIAEDYAFPYAQVQGFMAGYCKLGGRVTHKAWVPLGVKDYSSVIAKLPQDVDALLVVLGGSDAVNFLSQYEQAGGNKPMVGGSITVDHAVLNFKGKRRGSLLGTPAAGPMADNIDTPEWKKFVAEYRANFRDGFSSPSLFAYFYYVNMKAALDGLAAVNGDLSGNQDRYRAALKNLKLQTPTGEVTLDENRQAIGPTFITEVEKGADGTFFNKVVQTLAKVDQRLNLSKAEFEKIGLGSRDVPSCP